MRKIYIISIITIWQFFMYSCSKNPSDRLAQLVNDWNGKIIKYPSDSSFVSYNCLVHQKYDIEREKYVVVTYVDSIGCMSCKLQLPGWKDFINTLDSVSGRSVPCLFFFYPKNRKELTTLLKANKFSYPVFIDEKDSLNHFPSDIAFHTFLIDKNSKRSAMGNPVHNPKIRELYLNIITGNEAPLKSNICRTKIQLFEKCIDFGSFDWNKEQRREIKIQNIGDVPLVIDNVVTSCGCTHVEYDKKPVLPHKDITLAVVYKTEHPEHFSKTITIYSNAESSPIQLKITGNAK